MAMTNIETVNERIDRIESELEDIRDAVEKNTKNISKLYASVAAFESKVSTLIDEMHTNNNIIMTTFSQYKTIFDSLLETNKHYKDTIDKITVNMMDTQQTDAEKKWAIVNKVIDYIAKIAIIAVGAAIGLKVAGLI